MVFCDDRVSSQPLLLLVLFRVRRTGVGNSKAPAAVVTISQRRFDHELQSDHQQSRLFIGLWPCLGAQHWPSRPHRPRNANGRRCGGICLWSLANPRHQTQWRSGELLEVYLDTRQMEGQGTVRGMYTWTLDKMEDLEGCQRFSWMLDEMEVCKVLLEVFLDTRRNGGIEEYKRNIRTLGAMEGQRAARGICGHQAQWKARGLLEVYADARRNGGLKGFQRYSRTLE